MSWIVVKHNPIVIYPPKNICASGNYIGNRGNTEIKHRKKTLFLDRKSEIKKKLQKTFKNDEQPIKCTCSEGCCNARGETNG